MRQTKFKRGTALLLAALLTLSLAGCKPSGRTQRDIQQNTNNGPKVYLPVDGGPMG